MDLWFYPQKYEKFSKKRLSRLLIRCRPAVPLRIAGHPRFRPCAGRRPVLPCRPAAPVLRAAGPNAFRDAPETARRSFGMGGVAIRGRNVRFPRFCRVFGGSRRRPESPGESIFWPRVVFFRRKTVSSRRGIVIRRMLLRIQYALFVLLFVLLSAVVPASDGMRVRDEACATLCEQHVVPVPAPARFCFATVCSLPDMAGCPMRPADRSLLCGFPPMSVRRPVWPPLSEPRSPCTARRSVSARWITTSSRWGIF